MLDMSQEACRRADTETGRFAREFPESSGDYYATIHVAARETEIDRAVDAVEFWHSLCQSPWTPRDSLYAAVADAWRRAVIRIRPDLADVQDFWTSDVILAESGYRERPRVRETNSPT